MDCGTPGFPVLHYLSEFAQNSCALRQWCHPTISPCHHLLLPSIFPTIRVFSSKSALSIRWPEYWSFSFHTSPSKEYSGLISFRIDWFDLLAFQGPLKSLLQHHCLKVSILQCSVFFMVQVSHPYMTTGKTIALTFLVTKWKRIYIQYRRPRFDSWVGNITCRSKWQLSPVFLPGESREQRYLAGYSPWGLKSWTWLSN